MFDCDSCPRYSWFPEIDFRIHNDSFEHRMIQLKIFYLILCIIRGGMRDKVYFIVNISDIDFHSEVE